MVTVLSLPGELTDCPGYLAITINDRLESEELFKYDLLISCPPHFNLTFALPTLGLRQDKAFDVVFFDAKTEYRVFLNFIWTGNHDFTARTDLYGQLNTNLDHSQSSSGIYYFVVIAILSLSLTFVCAVVHTSLYFSSRAVQSKKRKKQTSLYSYSESAGLCAPPLAYRNTTTTTRGFRSLTPRRRFLILFYVFVRIAFSLLFTFSALSVLLRLCLRRPIDTAVATASNAHFTDQVTGHASDAVEHHFEVELRRQAHLISDMQRACSGYIDELSIAIGSWAQERAQGATIGAGSMTGVVQETFRRTVAVYQRNLRSAWGHQVRSIENQLRPMIRRHQTHVETILNGLWFQFPQGLFNASLKRSPQELNDVSGVSDLDLSEPDETQSFREFLHFDDEETIQLPLKSFIDW